MTKKATFHPKNTKSNSSAHISREQKPTYLIGLKPNCIGNYYEKIEPYQSDKQFIKMAKKIYTEKFVERNGIRQPMQLQQVNALIKEVVITVDNRHTKEDILGIFSMLQNEKEKVNRLKLNDKQKSLMPQKLTREFQLPKQLKVKRKEKKEYLSETGYHILELARHYDEGHFIRKGKWEELAYYPSKHIVLKDDGQWYIKSNELDANTDKEAFDLLADMSEFQKIYNLHWHVKFTHFNIDTGLTARFLKGEISGEGRLKKVAKYLGLRYVPEEKIPYEQGVRVIKEQYHWSRQEKYKNLLQSWEKNKEQNKKIQRREEKLAERVTNERKQKKLNKELEKKNERNQNRLNEQYITIKSLTKELEDKGREFEDKKQQMKDVEHTLKSINLQLEHTGFDVEGENVSEKVYDIYHNMLVKHQYFTKRLKNLEKKLEESKIRISARDRYNNELREETDTEIFHLKDEISKAEKIIEIIKEYEVPKEALEGELEEILEKIIGKIWHKKEENIDEISIDSDRSNKRGLS